MATKKLSLNNDNESVDIPPEIITNTNDEVVNTTPQRYKNIAGAEETPNFVPCTEEEYQEMIAIQNSSYVYDEVEAQLGHEQAEEQMNEDNPEYIDDDESSLGFSEPDYISDVGTIAPESDLPLAIYWGKRQKNHISILKKDYESLPDNGVLELITPDQAHDGLSPTDNPHYTKPELTKLIESVGFVVSEIETVKINNIQTIKTKITKKV